MAAVRREIQSILINEIEEREGKEKEEATVESAVDALAKCLGPVEAVFEATNELKYYALPLREDVRLLPLCVFKRLLKSEALQLQLENDAFALLQASLRYSSHSNCYSMWSVRMLSLFDELAPLLRFHHMI